MKRYPRARLTALSGLFMFTVAFCLRLIASVITTVSGLNPESGTDTSGFAFTAEYIANGLIQGQLIFPSVSTTYKTWGLFLSPFWLLPGPSGLYARVGNALLGALAIYNVYTIARYYHSNQAAIIAVAPLILYPSIIAVHTTLLREAIILFGITTAVRLIIIPPQGRFRLLNYGIGFTVLYIAYIQRPDNYPIYIVAFSVGLLAYAFESGYVSKRAIGAMAMFSPLFIILSWSFIQSGLEYLSYIRDVRGGGRTDYLLTVIPQTLPELTAFSWIGAAYFLYTPFPWMIETIPDLLVSIESLVTMGFSIAAVWGIRTLARKNKPVTIALITGLVLAIVFYGVGTVNYGTGMRHRQMFTWIIFLFGGIGIAEHVNFRGLPYASTPPENDYRDKNR